MEKEKKIITLSMCILFFSLIIIYSLFYQIKGNQLLAILSSLPNEKTDTPKQETESWFYLELATGKIENSWIFEWELFSDITTWNDALQVEPLEQNASPDSNLTFEGESPTILSWTDMYFGVVESIELLGLEPEYLLKDNKEFYYAKFKKEPDLKETVEALQGNIYTIPSEADMIRNNLFGDKISFINLPEYKDKLVVMMLTVNNQNRIIQMAYNKYHQSKNYLKTLFIQ